MFRTNQALSLGHFPEAKVFHLGVTSKNLTKTSQEYLQFFQVDRRTTTKIRILSKRIP